MLKLNKAERILRHGFALKRIFPKAQDIGPVNLYKRVHRLEAEAHSFAERCCNEYIPEDKQQRKAKSIMDRLDAILGNTDPDTKIPVFLNWDPRGYALKISDGYVRLHNLEIERDWGGYGIICPEF